ncbi:MAG TPA: PAS domain S-box protein [Methanoregula sp.]|nr:PAS domain S-box protein [Methanoregula sp.]
MAIHGDKWQDRVPALIALGAAAALGLNAYGLSRGITDVLPHLFYIPIILAAYFYPKRGTFFAAVLSAAYCALVFGIAAPPAPIYQAVVRAAIFIMIGWIVSYLSAAIRAENLRYLRYAAIVRSSTDAIIGMSMNGVITDWNAGAEHLYGYPASESFGRPVAMLLPPDRPDEITRILERIGKGETIERFETRRVTKDGRTIEVSLVISPITDHHGTITGASSIAHDITEQRRLRDEIIRARDEWERTFNAAPDMIAIIDKERRIVRINRAMADAYGVSELEARDRTCYDLVHKGTGPIRECPHALLLADGKAHEAEIHDGVLDRDIHVSVTPLRDSAGTITGSVHVIHDITGAKRAEEELKEMNQRLSAIIDFLPDPTFVINRDGKIVAWNRAIEKLSGLPASGMIGKDGQEYSVWFYGYARPALIDYVLHEDIAGIREQYPNCIIDGHVVRTEATHVLPDGTKIELWVSATPLFDPAGGMTGAIESLRNVTHIKRIERALKESRKYLDAIINTIADPVFVKNRNHTFVLVNDAFCTFTGHTRAQLIGKSDDDFFKKEEAAIFREKDEDVFRTGLENENEEKITDASGGVHSISTKKTRYTNTFGEIFIVGIIRDVTRIKQIENALQVANTKLNILSSVTRHDLVNKLSGLRTYLELSKTMTNDPDLLQFIAKEDEITAAMSRQIDFTRSYQNIGVNAPVWQDIEDTIRSAAAQLPLGGIVLAIDIRGVSVYADSLIEKVFYNLMENSLRHGGNVTSIRFSFTGNGDAGVIVYEDNGVGVAAEEKDLIFTRGFGKHTGLGLFLSREILAITGITITENGEPGKGVRFEIVIPAEDHRRAGSSGTAT